MVRATFLGLRVVRANPDAAHDDGVLHCPRVASVPIHQRWRIARTIPRMATFERAPRQFAALRQRGVRVLDESNDEREQAVLDEYLERRQRRSV